MTRHNLILFADYYQFFIQDEAADGHLSDAWTQCAHQARLAAAPGIVGVGTARNTDVPVTVDILAQEPAVDINAYEHIVECSISSGTGRLVVAGWADHFPDAFRIAVLPGTYRVRVGYTGLDSLSANGQDGDDRYHLQLWPAPTTGVKVLKHHPG